VLHAGEVGVQCCTADVVEAYGQRAPCRRRHNWLKRGKDALCIGLTERDHPHAGRNETSRERVNIAIKRRLKRKIARLRCGCREVLSATLGGSPTTVEATRYLLHAPELKTNKFDGLFNFRSGELVRRMLIRPE
jgi:hypothetical protein